MDWNELTFENIGIWPALAKVVLIAVLCAMLTGFGVWFLIRPQISALHRAEQEEIDLRATFEIKSDQAANYDSYAEQVQKMKQIFSTMLRQLPATSEVPNLIEDISKIGVRNGLEFKLIKPLPEIDKDFYAELPIEINVEGSYHQLAEFISQMASLNRIVTLNDFKISRLDKNDLEKQNARGEVPLDMSIIAKTYRYVIPAEEKVS